MNAEDFVELVRAGKDKLRVDNATVIAGSTKLRGRRLLRIEPDKLEIDLTLIGRNLPGYNRVTTKRDF